MSTTRFLLIPLLLIAIAVLTWQSFQNQQSSALTVSDKSEVGSIAQPSQGLMEPPRITEQIRNSAVQMSDESKVILASFGGQVNVQTPLNVLSVTDKTQSGNNWVWPPENLSNGVWLRSETTSVEIDFGVQTAQDKEIGNAPKQISDMSVKDGVATLTLRNSGAIKIQATIDSAQKKITIVEAGENTPTLVLYKPDAAKSPLPPVPTRSRLGKNYPWDPTVNGGNVFDTFATSVGLEARIGDINDELKGVLVATVDGKKRVVKIVDDSFLSQNQNGDARKRIEFRVSKQLSAGQLATSVELLVLSNLRGLSSNHKYSVPFPLSLVSLAQIPEPRITVEGTSTPASGPIRWSNIQPRPNIVVSYIPSASQANLAVSLLLDGTAISSILTSQPKFESVTIPEGQHRLEARILAGDVEKTLSQPLDFEVRTGGFSVTNVQPRDFGSRLGVNDIAITLTRPAVNDPTKLANTDVDVKKSDSGTIEGPFTNSSGTLSFKKDNNLIVVNVTGVTAGIHRLTIRGDKITDAFGNLLEGNDGKPGGIYEVILGSPTDTAGISNPLIPGVTVGQAKQVEYPPFLPQSKQPEGFNPNDRVETRVSRLYFYRDAHRVAQILNRRAQSYNRQDVTMRRQMADKARQNSEALISRRQVVERDAVVKAQNTRAQERKLSDAQRALNYSFQQMQQLAVEPDQGATQAERDAARQRRQAQLNQLDAATRNFADQVKAAEAEVRKARDLEVSSNEQWQQAQRAEELSRAEQFRLETAAAHADPDTFAEGKPDSIDPVAQVSISVIGEGLIHLRGPLTGVNRVRLMIDQIDAPSGQVRVNVHSTQINGEQADELEIVANRIQTYIDQARFLTLQSGEMLRKAVLHTAAMRAEETRGLFPGENQSDRDQRYLYGFYGKDFMDELKAMDSELLQTGNKLLSLHSMDVTSLSSALLVMALANNSTRLAILQEFERLLQCDLSVGEQQFLQNSIAECCNKKCKLGCKGKCKHNQPPPVIQLTQNATFTSLRGFFDANVAHNDTMTPVQREVIRLAQILKARLITEMELKQRVMERSVIEERLKAAKDEQLVLNREQDAAAKLRTATLTTLSLQSTMLPKIAQATAKIDEMFSNYINLTSEAKQQLAEFVKLLLPNANSNDVRQSLETILREIHQSHQDRIVGYDKVKTRGQGFTKLFAHPNRIPFDVYAEVQHDQQNVNIDKSTFLTGTSTQKNSIVQQLKSIASKLERAEGAIAELRPSDESSTSIMMLRTGVEELEFDRLLRDSKVAIISFDQLGRAISRVIELLDNQAKTIRMADELQKAKTNFLLSFSNTTSTRDAGVSSKASVAVYQEWTVFAALARQAAQGTSQADVKASLKTIGDSLEKWLNQVADLDAARSIAQTNRRPLDHKKFLDMLIDELEEKYIELLEGTRAHTSNIDNYLKRLTTSLDDDFNTQFYYPVFRCVRQASQAYKVQFGQTETTNVLANNREFAKVSPTATMEFDLPKRDILIKEGIDSALAIYNDAGALINDPNLLALTKMQSGQSTASPGSGVLGGYGAVRNVYPGLDSGTSSRMIAQNAGSGPEFESNVEKLIPDPAIYKFETGTGYEIRPVIAPDGQAVVFDFNYMYTTQIREPVRADEKHLGRIKQHFIDTDVQLSNFELREVSRYVVALKAARTAKGVPLLEDIPVIGALWRPLPSDEKSLQQNIIMAQATIFPTLFDLMGLRWAPSVSDLDPLRLSNREYLVRSRNRYLENRIYDYSSSRVDEFLRIPESDRRSDLYRSQETIPAIHPNGYQGRGLDIETSRMREGYEPQQFNAAPGNIPGSSPEGALYGSRGSQGYGELRGDVQVGEPIGEAPSVSRLVPRTPSPEPVAPGVSRDDRWQYSLPRPR